MDFTPAQLFLGALCSDSKLMARYKNLPSGIFTVEMDKRIFEAMRTLYEQYNIFDLSTILTYLEVSEFDNTANTLRLVYYNCVASANHQMYIDKQYEVAQKFYLRKLSRDMEHQLDMDAPGDVLSDVKEKITKLEQWKQQDGLPNLYQSFTSMYEQLCQEKDDEHLPKLRTGYETLDDVYGPLSPGQVHVIAARPRKGKSMFAQNIAVQVARSGFKVLYFSMEMGERQIMTRYLQIVHGLQDKDFKRPSNDFLAKIGNSTPENNNLTFCYLSGLTCAQVESVYIKEKELNGVDLVIIDHMHIMQGEGKEPTQQVSMVSRGLKKFAMNQRVPVIALAQMNRDTEKRTSPDPKLSDLAQSGAIEQDAETVLFLERSEEMDDDRTLLRGLLRKNRNGPGYATINYKVDFTTYRINEL